MELRFVAAASGRSGGIFMSLRRSARRSLLRACWMAGSAIIALAGTSTYARAQETTSYSYDALGRLVSSTASGGPNNGVVMGTCFDAAGNRAQYAVGGVGTPCSNPTPTPTPTPTNQPPVAVNDSVTMPCQSFATVNVTQNDSDPDNNVPLVVQSAWTSSGDASASVVGSSALDISTASKVTSIIMYVVADALGATATGSVTVTTTGSESYCNGMDRSVVAGAENARTTQGGGEEPR